MKKIILCLFAQIAASFFAKAQAPTWSADVATIIYSKCSNCHHDGGIGPFSLMSYQDAFDNKDSILANILNGVMPPWPPDTTYQRYAHERILTSSQIQTISDWVNSGTPIGNLSQAPNAPVFTPGSQIGIPNATFRIPDYTSTANTTDLYRCFVVPSGISVNNFLKTIEVIPGNGSIVHHVLVFSDTSGACAVLDANDPLPGYTGFGGVGSNSAVLIGTWVPGSTPLILPNGFGIKLPANSDIVIQIHYPAGTMGQMDSTRINLFYSGGSSVREVFIAPILNHIFSMVNGPLYIPANSVLTFEEQYTSPITASIFAVGPHMHLLGQNVVCYAVPPVGDTIPFIRINDWDFHWQGGYAFKHILKLPAGSSMHAFATYDNTTNNPDNPNNPPQNVGLGEATTDEMMLQYFTYTYYFPGDENISLEINPTGIQPVAENSIQPVILSPNPFTGQAYLSLRDESILPGKVKIAVMDISGKVINETTANYTLYESLSLDMSSLQNGMYMIRITDASGYFTIVKGVKSN